MKNGNGTCTISSNSGSIRKIKYRKEADALENLEKYQSDFYKSLGYNYVLYTCVACKTFHLGTADHKEQFGI